MEFSWHTIVFALNIFNLQFEELSKNLNWKAKKKEVSQTCIVVQ